MSVNTTADYNLESTKDHIKNAIRTLGAIVVDECYGHKDFKQDYEEVLQQSYFNLIKIQKQLCMYD